MEIITKTIERVLAETLARSTAAGIEEKTRPLANEINLLRIAIEGDWNGGKRRRSETNP